MTKRFHADVQTLRDLWPGRTTPARLRATCSRAGASRHVATVVRHPAQHAVWQPVTGQRIRKVPNPGGGRGGAGHPRLARDGLPGIRRSLGVGDVHTYISRTRSLAR